ncbi:flotillin domain-containing protein [Klenkia sp. LSe6-5]|uniref:Flotillin domain-containing protein n=1 Tax=Klenkia sesuvii TaxID=3103137 RepID=A0ABU8DRX0_9ACTN
MADEAIAVSQRQLALKQAETDAEIDAAKAEAAAILAKGKAEAESMDARSQAFSTYGEAAILDLLVKVLPEVVSAAAAPLSSVEKMTVISADGPGSLSKSVAANVAQGLQLSGDLTGLDVPALLKRLSGAAADGSGPASPERVPVDGA